MLTDAHPVTLYGFLLALFTLAAMVALTINGNVDSAVSVPIITGLGGAGIGAGAGIAHPNTGGTVDMGTVGMADTTA